MALGSPSEFEFSRAIVSPSADHRKWNERPSWASHSNLCRVSMSATCSSVWRSGIFADDLSATGFGARECAAVLVVKLGTDVGRRFALEAGVVARRCGFGIE